MKIFNTLSGKKEELTPLKQKEVRIFVCGPTVYDYIHIGNARTYIVFDAFVRFLRLQKYKVFYLQNITDLDDKIIARAKEDGILPKELAQKFETLFLEDIKKLGIESVTKYAKATQYIREIISQVRRLLGGGYAYIIEGDGVYYDILTFKDYGKLAHRTTQQAEDGISRIDESIAKRNKGDFVLWKCSKNGEPVWPFIVYTKGILGVQDGSAVHLDGRPGWHIEDTAITEKFFGAQYDIHGGARDLIFPHHEAEIAQMEVLSGKTPLARYWMHGGFLTANGEKMSKSRGNFITVRDFLLRHSTRSLRFFVLRAHYLSPIDYSESMMAQVQRELEKIDDFTDFLVEQKRGISSFDVVPFEKEFFSVLEDDFNTPKAIAVLFSLVSLANPLLLGSGILQKDAKNILNFFKTADKIFGCLLWGREKQEIPLEIQKFAKQREDFRKKQLWQEADKTKKVMEEKGWTVEDTSRGPRLKRVNS